MSSAKKDILNRAIKHDSQNSNKKLVHQAGKERKCNTVRYN
jgi:hypothetical protein